MATTNKKSKDVKKDKRSMRKTNLFDKALYNAAKDHAKKDKNMKMYYYLNNLLATDTGLPMPEYLKNFKSNED